MSYIDTRSLIETRDELKQQVLDNFENELGSEFECRVSR